jgi:hypothetical protein
MLTLLITLKIVSLLRKKKFNLKNLNLLFPKRLSLEKVSPPPALLGITYTQNIKGLIITSKKSRKKIDK